MLKKITHILFPLLIVIIALFIMAGFKGFYHYQFDKNNTYQVVDIAKADMPMVIDRLSGYVIGRYPQFNYQLEIDGKKQDVYGEREVRHMADVRKIFDITRYIAAAMAIVITAFFFTIKEEQRLPYLLSLTRAGLVGVVLITLSLGLLVVLDFSKYFVVFHEIFFDNDLWILNPVTDRLIQMLPEVFFRDMAVAIVGLAVILAGSGHLLAVVVNKKGKVESKRL